MIEYLCTQATNRSDSVGMEHLSEDLNRMNVYANTPHFDQMEESSSVEPHMEAGGVESSMKVCASYYDT